MSEAWDDRKKAIEEEYFRRKDKEAIEKMREKKKKKTTTEGGDEKKVSSALQCPKCDGALNLISYDGIEIDRCNKCGGVWLDAGELESLTKREEGGWFSRLRQGLGSD